MPPRNVQGQSADATELKQRGLGFAFRVGLTVIKKWPQYRYHYFDLHAGGGFNEEAGCIGSPLAFINAVWRAGCENYFAAFCDRDASKVKELLASPYIDRKRCHVFHGDNKEILAAVPDIITSLSKERLKYALGAVLSDPNGADVPIDAIINLAETCLQIDTIFHWNSTITKRLRNGIKPEQMTLDDVLKVVPKKFWLVREPLGIHQFTMAIGTNFRFGEWRSMGFFNLDSPKGQDIVQRCSLSKREIRDLRSGEQGDLPNL